MLLANSDRAFNQIMKTITRMLHKEILFYKEEATIPTQEVSIEKLEKFSWLQVLNEAKEKMPLVWSFLTNLVCPRSAQHRVDITSSPVGKQVPTVGFLLYTALYSRYPQKFKFFPSLNSVMIFKHGNSHAVSTFFLDYSLCTNKI